MSWPTTFWLYAGASVVFWLLVIALGGGADSDGKSVSLDWQLGALLNLGLLYPLAKRRVWAWHVLAFMSLSSAVVIGAWFVELPFALLAIPAATQFVLLWRLRTPRERVAEPRSTY